MFTYICIAMAISIIALLFFLSHKREQNHQVRFQTIFLLRQLVGFIRQHRQLTHQYLHGSHQSANRIAKIEEQINETHTQLSVLKPNSEVRILSERTHLLHQQWALFNLARNQIDHGRLIRQTLFLIDENMIMWLSESGREDLSEQYSQDWLEIFDCLDSLTQFRIAILDKNSEQGQQKLKRDAILLSSRLNKLSLLSPLTFVDMDQGGLMAQLRHLQSEQITALSAEDLYQVSSDASILIFTLYDQVISTLCEELYLPLPEIAGIKKPAHHHQA